MGCGGSKNEIKESNVQKEKHRKQHLDSNKEEINQVLNQSAPEQIKDERNQSHSVSQQEENLAVIEKQQKNKEKEEKNEEKLEINNEVEKEQASSVKAGLGHIQGKEIQDFKNDKDSSSAKDKKSLDSDMRRNGDAGSGNGDWHQNESREKPMISATGNKVEADREENKFNDGEMDCDNKETKSGNKPENFDKISEREKNSRLEDSLKSSERIEDSPKFPDAGHNATFEPVVISKVELSHSSKSNKSSRSNSPPSFSASKPITILDPSKAEN